MTPLARVLLLAGVLLAATPEVDPAPSPVGPRARRVLAPTGFPGWQARHVDFPRVVRDPATGLWRMYYTGAATDHVSAAAWDLRVTGVVTSRDLATWRYPDDYEPVLIGRRWLVGDVVDRGTGEAPFDAVFAGAAWVLRDGTRWRAWYTGWNGDERPLGGGRVEPVHFRIGHATSSDGVRWTKADGGAGDGATLGLGAPGDPDALGAGHPAVLKAGAGFRMWYEAYDGRTWRIATARSADGAAWTREGVALEPGPEGALDARGARHPVVRATPSGYEIWYQGRSAAHPAFHVLRARSADGLRWVKDAREVPLHPDPPVSGDERVHAGSLVARPDGSVLVFFAKETARPRAAAWGEVEERTTAIYSQAVRP